MIVILLLLLAVTGQSVALWGCPFPIEDLPTYQQVAKEVLKSLNTSFPKDVLTFSNAHTESIELLHCASASPAVRAGTTQYAATIFHPILWPNRTVYYSIRRSEYTPAAVSRLEAEIKWVNDNTCVRFEEVATCSAGEKCVVITHPSEETIKTYTPVGCPPADYKYVYYVSRTIELVENYGILDWIMWILGFMQDHNRYDRDKYLAITKLHDEVDDDWMEGTFLTNVQTIVHTVFPYDPQSATHMTLSMANNYGVNLTTLDPVKHVIKETPDGVLSPIDIQKLHYYYCREKLTYPVSSLPPEFLSLDDTTSDSGERTATTSPTPNTTSSSTTITPTTTATTTTTTPKTTPDPRFTLAMKFNGFDEEPPDESSTTITTSTTSTATTEATTTTTTEPTTTAFPMTSSGLRLPAHSCMRMLESALLLVTYCLHFSPGSGLRLPTHSCMRMLESALLLVTMVTYWLC